MGKIDKRVKNLTPKLNDVYDIYRKWLHIEDLRRIDAVLAVRLIGRIPGTRVWLIIVGPSGDWKSEQLRALSDAPDVKIIRNMTSRTIVNGNPKTPDLAPLLQNKTVIIQDFAQILKLPPSEKAEVWAQLRDLYDGFAGKQSGMGKDVDYKDLNVTLLAASTPAIDNQILIHQDLGTRELIWRSNGVVKKDVMMEMAMMNEETEDLMRYELAEITTNFLNCHKYDPDTKISPNVYKVLKKEAMKLTYMRACADVDSFNGELRGDVNPEMPTRVLKQFKRLFIALKSLDADYSDLEALEIIEYIVKSSSSKTRVKTLDFLMKDREDWHSTSSVAAGMKVGKKTAFKELGILWNMGFIKRRIRENRNGLEFHDWCVDGSIRKLNYIYDGFFKEITEETVK